MLRGREIIFKEIKDCKTILDLGCGKDSFLKKFKGMKKLVGVDIFKPYIKEARGRNTHDCYIVGDITQIEFKPKSFDVVIAIQVLEHIEKEKGLMLIEKMKEWGKKVIVSVPNGFLEQEEYDNNPFQEHKSSWYSEELEKLGFKVYGLSGLKLFGRRKILKCISQPIAFFLPKYANTLLGILNV